MPIPTLPKTAVKVDNFSGQFSKNSKKPKRKNHQQAKKSQKKPKSWSSNTDQNDSLDYKNQGFPKQFSKTFRTMPKPLRSLSHLNSNNSNKRTCIQSKSNLF